MFGDNLDTLLKNSRISHPEVFDRYFYFKTPTGDIANSEMELILSSTNDRTMLYQFLKENKELAKELINKLYNENFDISQFKDTFAEELEKLLKRAAKGEVIEIKKEVKKEKKEENLIAALKASLD